MGRRLPGLLLIPAGFAVVVVAAEFATAAAATASWATPLVTALAAAGFGLSFPWAGRRVDRWAAAVAVGVFGIYAAPVALSGDPTFAGYIKLDDTATWMAFVDQLMQHGRSLSGLAPSSYERTLSVNLPGGYPVGAFLPLGVGTQLSGDDVAWLVQPYMALMAGLLALCLAQISRPLVTSRRLAALVAFGAAQSALLFGYSLWGGVKEVAVALSLATLAALARLAIDPETGWRGVLPAAVAAAALLGIAGAGAAIWILPLLLAVAFSLWRLRGLAAMLARAWPLAAVLLALGVPIFLAAGVFSPTQGALTSASELGNLIKPLSPLQYFGVWPSGDFRINPTQIDVTYMLIALAAAAALFGLGAALRRRAWDLLLYVGVTGLGCLAVLVYSSPWVGAKALASGSPSVLALALAGAAAFALRVERILGLTVFGAILAGVLWSNVLGYRDVNLAPYGQMAELESIGHRIAGQGPTLMTEYQPYGVRHFLRDAEPEGVSELRYRRIPLRNGGEVAKGGWTDTDSISLGALLTYRTLVLRRNPAQSRPPSVYSLIWAGRYYEVWQRPPGLDPGVILEHLSLGSRLEPAAVPSCGEVLRMARLAGHGGELATVERPPTIVIPLTGATHPAEWVPAEPGAPDLIPGGAGVASVSVKIPRSGRYSVYLEGSTRNSLVLGVDGLAVGSVGGQLNTAGQFLYFGRPTIAAGVHTLSLEYGGQDLGPGSAGPPAPIGPLVLSADGVPPRVTYVPAARARTLCGRRLDWIEALR